MSWMTLRILFALCILQQVGCVQIKNRVDECAIKAQDKRITKRAWICHRNYWKSEPHLNDFRDGFKAGYRASLKGEECPPAIPPRFYWSASNNGADAHERTRAWFQGWWMGSVAVSTDGLFDHREVQIAPHLHQKANKPGIAWPESTSPTDAGSPLIPIPEGSGDSGPIPMDTEIPFVPPVVDPKTPDKEYSPSSKKKV